MIVTLYGGTYAPFMLAVAVAVRLAVLRPNTWRKNSDMVAFC
jgi:hypothetical protein